ncbi:MAG: ribonuclease PH [SAR324 cluster bacterium]|nr:ribonuclease PH [SAR324 cluster bacterium]MCZ6556687.1 ribonuclease PH [SAR324 cluster bacterium]
MAGDSLKDQAASLKSNLAPARKDKRKAEQPRPLEIVTDFTMHAEGSVLVKSGKTHIICTASVEDRPPPFLRGTGKGWVTAEYGMLPRATNRRNIREASAGKPSGRTSEIQRLIGRSLRSVTDLEVLGEHTIWLDCDVIQADGGTRTAAITGGFVALVLALRELKNTHKFARPPVLHHVAAVSVGLLGGEAYLDLDYDEDSAADVDLNVVMTSDLEFVEIQGTAEERPFSRAQLDRMLELAEGGITQRIEAQRQALGGRLI